MAVPASPAADRRAALDAVVGLLAAASIAASCVAIAYRPIRISPFAIVFALVASGIGGRHSRLAAAAVGIGGVCWLIGVIVAVITKNPLY